MAELQYYFRYIARMSFLNSGQYMPNIYVPCADNEVRIGPVKPLYESQRGFAYYDPELGEPPCQVFTGEIETVSRDLETDVAVLSHRVRRMRIEDVEYFALFNEGGMPIEFGIRIGNNLYEIWLPWSGKRAELYVENGWAHIHLEPRQSAILVPAGESGLPMYTCPEEKEPWWDAVPIRSFPVD